MINLWMRTVFLCIAVLLTSCGTTMTPSEYASETPKLDLQTYFNGTVDAWGMGFHGVSEGHHGPSQVFGP